MTTLLALWRFRSLALLAALLASWGWFAFHLRGDELRMVQAAQEAAEAAREGIEAAAKVQARYRATDARLRRILMETLTDDPEAASRPASPFLRDGIDRLRGSAPSPRSGAR